LSRKFELSFISRLLSLVLFFTVPALYVTEILPPAVLPLMAVAVVFCTLMFERVKARLLPSLFAVSLTFFFLTTGIRILLSAFHTSAADSLLLHIRLSSWIILSAGVVASLSTFLYLRFYGWKRLEPLVLTALLCLLFWTQGNHTITLFSHPIHATSFIFAFMLLQIVQLITVSRTSRKQLTVLAVFLPVLLAAVFFIVRAYNALSVTNNGGLIQPTLFRFDFSPYLSLQSEIKMNDNLVLIVRTREENTVNLLRRIYLSGWNTRKGFYEAEAPGETPQVKDVPDRQISLPNPAFLLRVPAEQEYFIVNFDPSSLIAMDYPIGVTPYRLWDSSAFNSAYAVTSETSGFIPFELNDSPAPTGNESEGLGGDALAFYTAIDAENLARLGELSRSITADMTGYNDKVTALTQYLREGDYRYSLKPGIAPDGDQLAYFLFDSKKGYCTYFAFSLCLMLRSIGIPSRIAAGFFIQGDSGALDYYPVRANMAHAWVEVFYPKYGWISFDPTTNQIADGEEIPFGSDAGGEEFIQLLNEIIDKRNFLTAVSGEDIENDTGSPLSRFLAGFFKKLAPGAVPFILILLTLLYPLVSLYRIATFKYSKNNRKVILLAADKMFLRLRRKGIRLDAGQNRRSLIRSRNEPDEIALFNLAQKARFAPSCTSDDARNAKELLAGMKIIRKGFFRFLRIFLLLSSVLFVRPLEAETAPELLSRAKEALSAENWENAIQILTEGIAQYPADPSFHHTLGTLYFDKSLYAPAYKEFLSAQTLGYQGTELYSRLSDTAGYLNKDEEALNYIKKYLDTAPDDLYAWSNFGWLCYKTHRLDEGISGLLSITENFGPDGNIYVGLGNLYTAAFNYAEAKKYYTLAIRIAEDKKQPYLASIYYYNRSILEEVFYEFELAFEDTAKSLEASPRSSGYLMQGELELRRLNYLGAFNHYLKAHALDATPLAALGLADTLIQAGYPVESERYLQSVKSKADYSWISNYGTTINQYRADFQKLHLDAFRFRTYLEKRRVVHNLSTLILRAWKIGTFTLLGWYHEAVYRIQTKNVARNYEATDREYSRIAGLGLYVNSFYFLAFDKWQKTASPYLDRAESIETGYIAAARPSYLYEMGSLKKRTDLLDESILTLNPVWERQYLSKALAARIELTKETRGTALSIKKEYLSDLYELDPSAFLYNDLDLPVTYILQADSNGQLEKTAKKVKKLLSGKGFPSTDNSRFDLIITSKEKSLSLTLKNRNTNRTVFAQVIHKKKTTLSDIAELINSFTQKAFRTDLGF